MPITVGEIRASVATMGDRGWGILARLNDADPVPNPGVGADFSNHRLASEVSSLDRATLVSRPISNPLVRARNLQLTVDIKLVLSVVDWRDRWGGNWLTTMQNQNPCNNCWAFASTALVETMVRIEHGVWAKRSEGDLRDGWGGPTGENWVVRDGPKATPCAHGAGITGAFDWMVANGIADPGCYSWSSMDKAYAPTADRNGRTVRVPKFHDIGDVADAKLWLDSVGPVTAGFDVYPDFKVYGGPDVYHKAPTTAQAESHYLLIVGYDDNQQCWIVRNSWGSGWGMGGYGLVGYGECRIDVLAKHGLTGTNPDPWTKRRLHAGNFFESGNGDEHRNFEMVRGTSPRAVHLWRDSGSGGFTWHEAGTLESPTDLAAGAACIGQPATTSTTYDRNFEAVYWEGSGRLRHWWMDQTANVWHDGGQFGPTDTEGYPAFIQSSYGAPGNLEVVVRRRGGSLVHWWREGAPAFAWHDGGVIAEHTKMSGPSLVQANIGQQGNFYSVYVTAFGNLHLIWRDDDTDHTWKRGEVFATGVGETPVCMIQGQFGATDELTPGNFELCVAVNGQAEHWWRDNSAIRTEAPRADSADRRTSDVIHAEGSTSAAHVEQEGVIQVKRTDLSHLLSEQRVSEVTTLARAGLAGATVSQTVDQTVAEAVIAAGQPVARWHRSAVFGHDVKHVWGLIQGSFGSNLEVVVETTGGALQHYFRDGDGWQDGGVIET